MKTKYDIKEFIESQLINSTNNNISDYSELDSLDKIDVVCQCENEFNIIIDYNEYESIRNSNTEGFIDFIMEKIEKINETSIT